MLSGVFVLVIVILLTIAILVLLTWSLYDYAKLTSKEINISNNPYCVRSACTNGTQNPAYQVTPVNDPEKLAYQSLNYCVGNSVPCPVLNQLQMCANGSGYTITGNDVKTIADFYYNEYYSVCSYQWGGGQSVNTTGTPPVPPQNDPNSPPLVNGPNDPAIAAIVACARTLGVSSDPNVTNLSKL